MDLKKDNDCIVQMETSLKKNILIRYDSSLKPDKVDPASRNVKTNIKTATKLKMTLPRLKPPSTQCKVSRWLNNCSHINFNMFQRPQASVNGLILPPAETFNSTPPSPTETFQTDVSKDKTVKQNILVRQDFHKSDGEKPAENKPVVDFIIRQSIDSNSSTESKRAKRKLFNPEAPLSPESRKKSELCSYLQLMDLKHPELKNGNVYKNRRSTRVKNLLIMSEKKELEKKLSDEAKVKENFVENDGSDNVLSKKSFQELNMVEEVENVASTAFTDAFRPKYVPQHLLYKKADFEDFVKDYVSDHRLHTKKVKYLKENKKENRQVGVKKMQLQRLKTLRKKQPAVMKKEVVSAKPLRKRYVKKEVASTKKANIKYTAPAIRSLRSANMVMSRSKTLRNLRKRSKNLPVRAESKSISENKPVKVSVKKKLQNDAVSGKENHKKKEFNFRKRNVEGSTKKLQISRSNNQRILRNSFDRKKVIGTVKTKKHKTISSNVLKVKVNQPSNESKCGADEPKLNHKSRFIKYNFEKNNTTVLSLENDKTVNTENHTATETSPKEDVKVNLEPELPNLKEIVCDLSEVIATVEEPVIIQTLEESKKDEDVEDVLPPCPEQEEDVQECDADNELIVGDNKLEGDSSDSAVLEDDYVVGDVMEVEEEDEEDDDVIFISAEMVPFEKQDDITTTTLQSQITTDEQKPTFSAKALEDLEKKYSSLTFNNSTCAESDEDTSSITRELLAPDVEETVYISGSTCSGDGQEYQINIAISEHNYTRSPASVPIEYELVECENIVEHSSSLLEEDPSKITENSLDIIQIHTLDEIKRIIHGDAIVTVNCSNDTPESLDDEHIIEAPNSIVEVIEEMSDSGSKTSEEQYGNNNEENQIPTESCSSVSSFGEGSIYKLNSCNSISNESREPEEKDLLSNTCDITELQSSLKPVRTNGSMEDFKGFNNSLEQRQSPKLIEFNENNLPKSVNRRSDLKSLHRNLLQNKRKLSKHSDNNKDEFDSPSWTSEKNEKKSAHTINVLEKDGEVLDAYYFDYNLIVTQDLMISFWTQSALGVMLEAQNMWIPRGSIQRLALDNNCVQKKTKECVITTENCFAYVELWTKEHKSDKRERPVADVFAVIYFWRNRQMGPEKKFLQLENINGFADDVQYVVLKNSAMILVSWRIVRDETTSSIIHCYQLANDFQTVVSIKEMESVEHTISSLHNIEDCDSLVMGCGEKQVTIWNLEHGFIVATIDTSDNLPEPLNLWVKCDRGFLFLLQHCSNNIFKLIAINGMNQSWKRLQIYKPPPMGFDRFRGVCIENGILIAFYSNGILCWNVQSGDLIMEELCNDVKYLPSGKHIITYTSENLLEVKNALSFLITNYDFSET